MASEWNDRKQNASYRGKCQWNFNQGKGGLVRVSGLLAGVRVISGFYSTARHNNIAYLTATWRGVYPLFSTKSIPAPFSTKNLTTSAWLHRAAWCSTVKPSESLLRKKFSSASGSFRPSNLRRSGFKVSKTLTPFPCDNICWNLSLNFPGCFFEGLSSMAASSFPRLRGVTVAPDGNSFVLIVGLSGIIKKTTSILLWNQKEMKRYKIQGIQPTLSRNSLSPKSNQHQFFSSQQHQQIITRLDYENKIIKYNHRRQNALPSKKFSQLMILGNVWRSVWRICMLG